MAIARNFSAILTALLLTLAASSGARAGTVTLVSMQYSASQFVPHFHFDGPVVTGDLEAFEDLFQRFVHCSDGCFSPEGNSRAVVTLNSPGGNYNTGLALARYFREKSIATVVENGSYCYSACAFAFLGGSGFSTQNGVGAYIDRTIQPGAIVGFHAPYYPPDSLTDLVNQMGVDGVLGGNREAIALMVEKLVEWNVDPRVIARMVLQGPNETYDLASPEDLYMVRANLPNVPTGGWVPEPETALRNACARLLAIRDKSLPSAKLATLTQPLSRDYAKDEFGNSLTGFVLGTELLSLGSCGMPTAQFDASNYAETDIALYMTPGIQGTVAPLTAFFNREKGWSSAGEGGLATTRIFAKGPLSHFFMDPAVRFDTLEAGGRMGILADHFFTLQPPALPVINNAGLETIASETTRRIDAKGDVFVFTEVGNEKLFETAKAELDDADATFSHTSESDMAFIRTGTYKNSNDGFSWIGFLKDGKSALIRIEIAKPDGTSITADDLAISQAAACGIDFGGTGLNCGK